MPTFAAVMEDYERQIRLVISPDVLFRIDHLDYGNVFQAAAINFSDSQTYSFTFPKRAPDLAREQAAQLMLWLRAHQLTRALSDGGKFEWEID